MWDDFHSHLPDHDDPQAQTRGEQLGPACIHQHDCDGRSMNASLPTWCGCNPDSKSEYGGHHSPSSFTMLPIVEPLTAFSLDTCSRYIPHVRYRRGVQSTCFARVLHRRQQTGWCLQTTDEGDARCCLLAATRQRRRRPQCSCKQANQDIRKTYRIETSHSCQ